jgi:cupin fold WbuC family metalloprotein
VKREGSYRRESAEVFYAEPGAAVDAEQIAELKRAASQNPRKRVRLCAHDDTAAAVHEMLIVHERGTYVRPHKHLDKAESMHVIEGLVDVVVFDESGDVARVIPMGDYQSGRAFYNRLGPATYHTLVIRSDVLVFHETIEGPFERRSAVFASWAPEDGDAKAVDTYLSELEGRLRRFR